MERPIIHIHLVGREDLDPEVYIDDKYMGTWDQLDLLWLLDELSGKEVFYTRKGEFYE